MHKLSFFGLLFFIASVSHTMENKLESISKDLYSEKDKDKYVDDMVQKVATISVTLNNLNESLKNQKNRLDEMAQGLNIFFNTNTDQKVSTTLESHDCNPTPENKTFASEIIVSLDEAKLSALFSLFNVDLPPYAKPYNFSMTRAVSNDPGYPTLFTFNASVKLAKDTDPLVAVTALTEQMKSTTNLDYKKVGFELMNNMFSENKK